MRIIFCILTLLTFSVYAKNMNSVSIQKELDSLVKEFQIIGAQLTIQDLQHNKSWNVASGYANKSKTVPLETTHLMQIGSNTKSFVSALLLLLEQDSIDGKLKVHFRLEDSLSKWFPEYKNWGKVQVKQLLNMTSGIYNYTDDQQFINQFSNKPLLTYTAKEIADLSYAHKPNVRFKPGEGFEYSNTNYILASILIEKLTGSSLPQNLKQRIFDKYPTKLKDAFYETSSLSENMEKRMARGYMLDPDVKEFFNKDITGINLSWAGAAGAMFATASDLANWSEILFTSSFLTKKQRKKLEHTVCMAIEANHCKAGRSIANNTKDLGYGLGVMNTVFSSDFGGVWKHGGNTMGFSTNFYYFPELFLIVALSINQVDPIINQKAEKITTAIVKKFLTSDFE